MIHKIIAILIVLAGTAIIVEADGLKIKNGKYDGGKSSVLAISKDQINIIDNIQIILLTKPQMEQLFKEAGVSPTRLSVYNINNAENDCTCFTSNIAIIIEANKIEVPHQYLYSDEDAKKREPADED